MAVSKKEITLGRLRNALERLLEGKPTKVKVNAKLTLNRVNKEAGLSQSYIHKFPEFIKEAEPQIVEFNNKFDPDSLLTTNDDSNSDSIMQSLRHNLSREKRLKEKYKQERDDLRVVNQSIVARENGLLFQLYELQQTLEKYTEEKTHKIN